MKTIEQMIRQAEAELTDAFARIDENETARTRQILDAFRQEGVSYRHFAPSTGYGYDDISRNTLERIYAAVFHTEAALMRPHVASGTAALSLTLFGMTRPGEKIVSATGMPYDTLQGVIGILDGMNVQKIPANRLPKGFGFMIAHPCATVAPVKLEDYKIHENPPGISGSLVEGRIVYDASGRELFNFGKYRGMPVDAVLDRDPGYYGWMMNGDFTLNTKQVLTRIKLRGIKR
jgi:hypothetical protein